MTKQFNIMEVLNAPEGSKFKVVSTSEARFQNEIVVVRGLSSAKTLAHVERRGERRLALTGAIANATYEEYQEVEFVEVDFTALASANIRQVYVRQYGEYRKVNIYTDLEDYGVRDTDDLRRKTFYEKKVNGVYETK